MRPPDESSQAGVSAAVPSVEEGAARSPATAAPPVATAPAANGRADAEQRRRGPAGLLVWGALAVIVAVGLYLRLHNNGYGLPYVYNYDEATHFTDHAVAMLGSGNLDPGYYQNPSGLTYLMYIVLKVVYGILGVHLAEGSVARQFAFDPTPIFELARGVVAVLAMLGVVATFGAARRFWGAGVALIAAALLTFAFLPVTYSRIAVTDVGTFLPVAVAVWAALRVYEEGHLKHYLIAGGAVGFACGFKYTAGLAILPLLVAAGVRIWRDKGTPWLRRRELWQLVGAGALLVVCFGITTPYDIVHPRKAGYQIKTQAQAAGDVAKLGQGQQGGLSYYLHSFGWGFGWGAIVAAVIGAVFELRRNLVRGIMLTIYPVALFLYMGTQTRYFGRWMLPMYPVLAILAGVGIVRTADLVRRWVHGPRAWALSGALAAVIAAVILIQPVAADVRTMNVLGREDTRQLARDYLVKHYPQSARTIIEPAVPDSFYRVAGVHTLKRQFVRGFAQDILRRQQVDAPLGADTTYAATLNPQNIDAYRAQGFCTIVTMSLIRGRAENAQVPQALAYYKRLERESTLIYHVSPFKKGRAAVPLHYDFSYDYYPTAYYRPGAVVDIYRLHNCTQGTGRVPAHPYGDKGLDKGIGTSYTAPRR